MTNDGSLSRIFDSSEKQTEIIEDSVRHWEDTGQATHCVVFAGTEVQPPKQETSEAIKDQPITFGYTRADDKSQHSQQINHDRDTLPAPIDGLSTSYAKLTDISDHVQAGDVTESTDKLTELENEDGKRDASDLEKPADTLSNSYAGNGGNSVCGSPQPSLILTESSQNQDDIPIRRDSLTTETLSKLGHGASANTKDEELLQTSKEDSQKAHASQLSQAGSSRQFFKKLNEEKNKSETDSGFKSTWNARGKATESSYSTLGHSTGKRKTKTTRREITPMRARLCLRYCRLHRQRRLRRLRRKNRDLSANYFPGRETEKMSQNTGKREVRQPNHGLSAMTGTARRTSVTAEEHLRLPAKKTISDQKETAAPRGTVTITHCHRECQCLAGS